ncbi:MAG TPA: DUF5317 domain-containing protein [Acidimicrobiia bacterium]|jgi:hypothetical protein
MSWLVLALVVAAIVSVLRGGKFSNVGAIRVRAWWLLVIGLAMQLAGNFLSEDQSGIAVGLMLTSYALLLIVVLANRNAAGLWIAGFGVTMNLVVIAVNGAMPVLSEAIEIAGGNPGLPFDAKHELLDASTRLPFLADVIPIPGSVISLGDVFLSIGLAVFVEDQLRTPPALFSRGARAVPGSAAEL